MSDDASLQPGEPPEGAAPMIVRMWHGRVPTLMAARYRQFLKQRAIPDYRAVAGNLGVQILERVEGGITHFITLSFWQDMAAIRGFAGHDIAAAKYYPEDSEFLIEFEPTVLHYTVVGRSG